jgi:hypothetical protein
MRSIRALLAAAALLALVVALGTGASASGSRARPLYNLPVSHGVHGISRPLRSLRGRRLTRELSAATIGSVNINGIGGSANSGTLTGAAGPNNVIEVAAGQMDVCTKAGSCTQHAVSSLFSNFQAGQCNGELANDASVAYDTQADRFVIVASSTDGYPTVCFAVTTGSDPNGTWYTYAFALGGLDTGESANPELGIWTDGYWIGWPHTIDAAADNAAFVFQRSEMLKGGGPIALGWTGFDPGPYGSVIPTNLTGPTAPPAGRTDQLWTVDPGTYNGTAFVEGLHATSLTVSWSAETIQQTTTTHLPYAQEVADDFCFSAPPSGVCVPQPGTGATLGAFGGQISPPINYRNNGGTESIVLQRNHDLGAASPPHYAVEWHEIRMSGNNPTIYQGDDGSNGSADYAPDGNDYWMGSLAVDKNGDVGMGYDVSSTTVKPSIRITGHLAGDAPGSMNQGQTTVVSSGTVLPVSSTWTPSAMTIDPDGCTFWLFSGYVLNSDWQSRITSSTLPGCANVNLAKGKTATASSSENSSLGPANAVDGNTSTRWSSAFSDPQWLKIDLGATHTVTKVVLRWEAAYAKAFQIQMSSDGTNWGSPIYSTTTGTGGTQTLTVNGSGRYIRMYGTKRATQYGYSLYEMEVYGS